ncbi:unnamed protein product [Hymenolepis diminuta]|uniref:Uncharacterized protein n=1 Tax=Hymenolepis diminuta TaxID=6216 RepID=A0A564Y5Z3_HYMDI|nr:unnamed protein product [Hymenolepis diminuta]
MTVENKIEDYIDRRDLLDFTNFIQATSSNPICSLILKNTNGRCLKYFNAIFTDNVIVKAIFNGASYDTFEGSLHAYPAKVLLQLQSWAEFWTNYISRYLVKISANPDETRHFYFSNMSNEAYHSEMMKFLLEIKDVLDESIILAWKVNQDKVFRSAQKRS